MKRRDFFRLLGYGSLSPVLAFPLACSTAVTPPDEATGLSLGYVSGEVTPTSALIWLRALPGPEVALQYGNDPAFSRYQLSPPIAVRADADHTAIIPLNNLKPATRYFYRAIARGRQPGPIGRFVTAPQPKSDPRVSFCFSGDTRETYKPFTIMEAVRRQQPDFFLHLGDTVYADRNGAATTLKEFWDKYRVNRDDTATQACHLETSFYATWDDHEVANDFEPDHPLMPVGRRAFFDYWPVRRNQTEPERLYRSFRWGEALELFILDSRQYRDRRQGTMLGRAQKEWLFDQLGSSSALFKFVGSPAPLAGGGKDRWDGFPRERAELLRFIQQRKLRGIVFLSADLHYAAITRIPKSGGLKDITAGPLAAPLNRVTNGFARRFEFFLAENFNFAKITVDPKADPDHTTVEFIDQDNQIFHRASIAR